MKNFFLLTFLLVCWATTAFAQRTVTGTVTGADSEPIVGASVVITGTTLGTITDVDGNFSLSVPEEYSSLTISSVGYRRQDVAISGTTVTATLEEDIANLDEVVITALGIPREEKSLPFSTQQVNMDNVGIVRTDNFVNNLQGKVAGVQISTNSNMGGSSRILIRGASSIVGENQPLFVVDGVPMDNRNFNSLDQQRGGAGFDYGNALADINPDDIELVNILKGAPAAALYGSRANNGVVIITTKKARILQGGRRAIGVSVNSGVSWEMVSLFPEYQNEYGGGYGSELTPEEGVGNLPSYDIDESWVQNLIPTCRIARGTASTSGIPKTSECRNLG